MKRLLATVLSLTMALAMLAGCAPQEETATPETDTPADTEQTSSTDSDTATEDGLVPQPEGYPDGIIEWVVPAAAGSILDIFTRKVIENIDLGGDIAVINIDGGSQTIGTTDYLSREADGMSIMTSGAAGLITQPISNGDTLVYTVDDFIYPGLIQPYEQNCISVRAESELNTAQDWVDLVTGDERVTYTATNPLNFGHVAAIATLAEIDTGDVVFVPYSGSAEANKALLAGEVDFLCGTISDAVANEQTKILAIVGADEVETLPGVEPLTNYGVDEELLSSLNASIWLTLHKDTPEDVAAWIKQQFEIAVRTTDYTEFLASRNLNAFGEVKSTEEIKTDLDNLIAIFTEVINDNEQQ